MADDLISLKIDTICISVGTDLLQNYQQTLTCACTDKSVWKPGALDTVTVRTQESGGSGHGLNSANLEKYSQDSLMWRFHQSEDWPNKQLESMQCSPTTMHKRAENTVLIMSTD